MTAEVNLPINREPPPGTFMTQWVIYEHPGDHPDGYVLRAAFIRNGAVEVDNVAWYSTDVERLREILPPFLHRLPRFENDDPAILEVWL